MDAQGALDSLLGRLTTVLVNEAQLLGGVRGDVEFIKDEMESMNGLLLHLTEAQHRDHQVRAWMKQVSGLTRDCGGNVELYVHYVGGGSCGGKGILGFVLRIPRFLRTVSVRRQIATRIRELKVRARDVGDRRHRYGVTVPQSEPYQHRTIYDYDRPIAPQPDSQEQEEELHRRELLDRTCSPVPGIFILEEGTNEVLEQLSLSGKKGAEGYSIKWPRIIGVTVTESDAAMPPGFARRVYEHSSVVSSFECRAFVDLATVQSVDELYRKILEQLPVPPPVDVLTCTDEVEGALGQLLNRTKFIIVLDNVRGSSERHDGIIREFIRLLRVYSSSSLGSSIIASTPERSLPYSVRDSCYITIRMEEYLERRALVLAKCYVPNASNICLYCNLDTFAFQMFFRLVYASPILPANEMGDLENDLTNNQSNTGQIMLRFCFKYLPSNHKSCLLYLSIFPQGHKIRRTSLLRRWIAEGLVSQRSNLRLKDKGRHVISMLDDEAEHVFDALVTRGFLHPEETSAAGKIKTFTVPAIVHGFITEDLSYMDTSMLPDLAHRLSINNGVQLHVLPPSSDRPFGDVLTLLEQITGSVPWQLLKVLDLEGCRGLTKKKHLESICQILLLKYLSLRDTDVSELPKHIEKLQCLETLDIRQTMVHTFSTKQINLPLLKYFLAGRRESPSNSLSKFKDPFTTVSLPRGIRRMKNLQVLSYVEVSDNMKDLNDVGRLLQLRKLGVILHNWEGVLFLFRQIERLNGCLRSLSVRINQPPRGKAQATTAIIDTPPKHLQSLNISGITSGLPPWIAVLDQLEEISLSETYLGEDAMNILSNLRILRCLQLLHNSYTECNLNFRADQFQQLRSLVVEGSGVTNISFHTGTAPKLRTIVWSFSTMEAFSGLKHLPKLNKLELHGDCNLDPVKTAIEAHPNHPVLKHNPLHQHQENRTAAAEASSSSAP